MHASRSRVCIAAAMLVMTAFSSPRARADRPGSLQADATGMQSPAQNIAPGHARRRASDRDSANHGTVKWKASGARGKGAQILFYRDGLVGTCAYQSALETGAFGEVTFTQSPTGFASLLQEPWDLVVSANQSNDNLGTFQAALVAFRLANPKAGIIVSEWNSFSAGQYLPAFGIDFSETNSDGPLSYTPGGILDGLASVQVLNPGWSTYPPSVFPSPGQATTAAAHATGTPAVAVASGRVIANGFLSDSLSPASAAANLVAREIQYLLGDGDSCSTPQAVTIGTTAYVTAGGSTSRVVRSGGTAVRTVWGPKWFVFTPPVTGMYDISLCGGVGDALMAIAADCSSGGADVFDSIAFNDDACACSTGCGGEYSPRLNETNNGTNTGLPLVTPLTAGTAYRIVIGGFSSVTGPLAGNMVIALAQGEAATTLRIVPQESGNFGGCFRQGSLVTYDVFLDSTAFETVAVQVAIDYVNSNFTLVGFEANWVSPGGFPFTTVPWQQHDEKLRTVSWISSITPGIPGGFTGTHRIASLTFETAGDDCGTTPQVRFAPAALPIIVASGNGDVDEPTLVAPQPIVVDDTGPALSNVPEDRVVPATQDDPCQAVVELVPPTAVDGCSGPAGVIASRSDGLDLASPFPCGTTVVTWTAADACDRRISRTTEVTVSAASVELTLEYAGAGTTGFRCITLRMGSVQQNLDVLFQGGIGIATTTVPVGDYSCATLDDPLHSLVTRVSVTESADGTLRLDAVGADALVPGDLNDDNLVNVVDWAVYVVRDGTAVAFDPPCGTTGFHPDFEGDGVVTSSDGLLITANFLRRGDTPCGTAGSVQPPVTSIRIDDLAALIGPDAALADLDGNGLVDLRDVDSWRRLTAGPGSPRRR